MGLGIRSGHRRHRDEPRDTIGVHLIFLLEVITGDVAGAKHALDAVVSG